MTTDKTSTLAPGSVVGRYRIVRELGAGGMGRVYEAVHVDLQKRVALKTLVAAIAYDAEAVARFVREGQAAARIRHPSVVDVADVGVSDGTPYLGMEYLDGEDLATARAIQARTLAALDVADAAWRPRLVALLLPAVDAALRALGAAP